MSDATKIRKACVHDAAQILDIHTRAIRALCATHYSPHEIEAWTSHTELSSYEEAIRGQREELYVTQDNATAIVAFSAIGPKELRALYVDPDHAHNGLGRQLLAATEDFAREAGMPALYLDASLNAVHFYQRQGYDILCPSFVLLPEGSELPSLRMKKRLT